MVMYISREKEYGNAHYYCLESIATYTKILEQTLSDSLFPLENHQKHMKTKTFFHHKITARNYQKELWNSNLFGNEYKH